jgi:hypothetical protein
MESRSQPRPGNVAPDYIEPFLGWRIWRLQATDDGHRLTSWVQDATWEPGRALEASCQSPKHSEVKHECPCGPGEHPMECGIYSVTNIEVLRDYLSYPAWIKPAFPRAIVFGLAKSWGRVVEYEHGYRAQYSYPSRLWVLVEGVTAGLDPRGLDAYGVPVDLIETPSRFNTMLTLEREYADERLRRAA